MRPVVLQSYDLSPIQSGMLFHALSQPGSGIDIEQVIARLDGPIDRDALVAAWRQVIDRHPVLRSAFRWEDIPAPVQDVWALAELPVEHHDWRDRPSAQLGDQLAAFLSMDRKREFAMAVAPLMRLTVIRLPDEHFTVVWTFHHSLLDGRSFPIVLREVFSLYDFRFGGNMALSSPRPFRSHVEWLHALDLAPAEAYWRKALKGFRAPVRLWVRNAGSRGQVDEPGFEAREIELPGDTTAALKAAAAAAGVTINTVLQGAWALLLSRLSGERDIVFGATRACRRSGLEGAGEMVGLFINTLPVRIDADPEAELGSWLAGLRQQSIELRQFEHTPLLKVQAWSEVARGEPLFESLLVYEHLTLDAQLRALGGAWQSRQFQYIGQTNFPLALIAYGGERLLVRLEYALSHFEDEAAGKLLECFAAILEQMTVTALPRRLEAIAILPEKERSRLIALGRPKANVAMSAPLHSRFEQQARLQPDRVAVSCAGQSLSYAELNARANRLARHLRSLGVRPDELVGLSVERGLGIAIGILAILKSGGAYLPLDPAYPHERIAFMLEDARVRFIVCDAKLEHQPVPAGVTIVSLDNPGIETSGLDPAPVAGPQNLAYAIYTSGSTGRPKGALITHANVTRLFDATDAWFGFGPTDVWTLFHSYAFDFSVWELWGALLYGGRVVIVPYWVSRDPSAFRTLLVDERVSVLNQTPSAFRQLVQADMAEPAASYALRTIVFGGEALELQSLQPWFERYGDRCPQLVNMYGITETTVHVTYRPITMADVERGLGSVIGEPIPDVYIHLFDAHGEPVPDGVPGEVHVGGAGVARGYLNRPELTAQRFIPDPFDPSGHARVYRTGDLARRLSNGDLEFHGRIDNQVKIRGFRIELGEIEAAIAKAPHVADAAVIAREDNSGEKRLVAYIVVSGGMAGVAGELRLTLAAELPGHMIPAHFVFLDSLPLDANGKLDRPALPAPVADRVCGRNEGRPRVAPRSEMERTLAAIWQEALRLDNVGVTDHFFELGGDSILSIQVVTRCRRAGIELSARDLFEHPTIAGLAARVTAARQVSKQAVPLPRTGPVPLTPIQHWFFEQGFAEASHWNQAFLFHVPADLDLDLLERSIEAVAAHHDALRLRFSRSEAGWVAQHAAQARLRPIARHDLSGEPAEHHAALIEAGGAQHQAELDLALGPLLRVAHFALRPGARGRLLVIVHHLVVDGVSWRILLEDIEAAYHCLASGRPPALPDKTSSYSEWAERLVEHARTPAVADALEHWRGVGAGPTAGLPLDGSAVKNLERDAESLTVQLTAQETASLLHEVPAAYRTQINDVLLTALARTLQQCTGAKTHLIDIEGHGREDIGGAVDVSRTVGWFTTLFPVCLDIEQGAADGDALKAIKQQLRRIPDRGLSYGLLRYLSADASARAELGAGPPRQLLFNYLGQFDQVVAGSRLFAFAGEQAGPWHAPNARRPYPLEVLGLVRDGKLAANWIWNSRQLARATIAQLADGFLSALRSITAHCMSPEAGGRTPADFPLANLGQAEIDALWASYPRLEDVYPLTPMQRLFFVMEAARTTAGFEQWQFQIDGMLDPARLRTAFEHVLSRHPILRTAFLAASKGEPVQVVVPAPPLPWAEHDLGDLGEDEQQRRMAGLLAADRASGFDLARPPLMRTALVRLGPDLHHLVWSTHHLCIDGWSWPLLFKEVCSVYAALERGTPAALDPTPGYGRYVAWLSNWTAGAADFWSGTLAGIRAPTPISLEAVQQPRRDEHSDQVDVTMRLPRELSAILQATARANQLTLSTLVQGAWGLLLAHYSGASDVVFGAAFSGRPAELDGIAAMIGPCVTNVPVRIRLNPSEPLLTWLVRLQRQQLDLAQHQYTPLETIQGFTGVPWHSRLFDSLLVFQNYRVDDNALQLGAHARLQPVLMPESTNYDLTIAVQPGEELRFRLIHNPARVSHASARIYVQDLKTLLAAIGTRPGSSLAELLAKLPAQTRGKAAAVAAARRAQQSQRSFSGPSGEIESRIAAIWQELLGVARISVDDNFFDMGGQSLLLLRAHRIIQSELGVEFSIVTLLQFPTVRALARQFGGGSAAGDEAAAASLRAKQNREALQRQRRRSLPG